MTTNSPVSRTRRNARHRDGYRIGLGSIQEGVNNMSLSGTDGFSAGTPDKRSSQPFGNNPRRDHVKNPTQSERTFTEGRSDDTTSTRTNTSDESFAEYHHSAANLSPEEKADGPICLVGNGFDFSDDDVEEIEDHLGGSVVYWGPKYPRGLLDEMTCLVASQDRNTAVNTRTTPLLVAISKGIHIVPYKWLQKSLEQGTFLPLKNFLLKDDSAAEFIDMTENVYDTFFPLSEAIEKGIVASSKGGILNGFFFALCKGLGTSEDIFTKKELQVLLEAAGAKQLTMDMLKEAKDTIENVLVVTSMTATDDQINFADDVITLNEGGMRVTIMLILQILLLQSLAPLERLIEAKVRAAAEKEAAFHIHFPEGKELWSMELVGAKRTLSKPGEGDENRGNLGDGGTLKIVRSEGTTHVLYFDQDRKLTFKAKAPAPPKFLSRNAPSPIFGNAGKQNVLVWEVTNCANGPGDQKLWRRHFFWFHRREQLDTCLVKMFGTDTVDPLTNQSILEAWYDESSKFCEKEFNVPAHDIVKEKDAMDEEHPVRGLAKPRGAEICEQGCNPYGLSQQV